MSGSCGSSNDDVNFDVLPLMCFLYGKKLPMAINAWTQLATALDNTLETGMNGHTRYIPTAVWIGNAHNSFMCGCRLPASPIPSAS